MTEQRDRPSESSRKRRESEMPYDSDTGHDYEENDVEEIKEEELTDSTWSGVEEYLKNQGIAEQVEFIDTPASQSVSPMHGSNYDLMVDKYISKPREKEGAVDQPKYTGLLLLCTNKLTDVLNEAGELHHEYLKVCKRISRPWRLLAEYYWGKGSWSTAKVILENHLKVMSKLRYMSKPIFVGDSQLNLALVMGILKELSRAREYMTQSMVSYLKVGNNEFAEILKSSLEGLCLSTYDLKKIENEIGDDIEEGMKQYRLRLSSELIDQLYINMVKSRNIGVIREQLKKAEKASKEEKGESLEKLAELIFGCIYGVSVTKKETMNEAGGLDRIVHLGVSESTPFVLGFIGEEFLVECKNEQGSVEINDTHHFLKKIETEGVLVGIIVSIKGLSGKSEGSKKFSEFAKRLAAQDGSRPILLLDFDLKTLKRICEGESVVRILDTRLRSLWTHRGKYLKDKAKFDKDYASKGELS